MNKTLKRIGAGLGLLASVGLAAPVAKAGNIEDYLTRNTKPESQYRLGYDQDQGKIPLDNFFGDSNYFDSKLANKAVDYAKIATGLVAGAGIHEAGHALTLKGLGGKVKVGLTKGYQPSYYSSDLRNRSKGEQIAVDAAGLIAHNIVSESMFATGLNKTPFGKGVIAWTIGDNLRYTFLPSLFGKGDDINNLRRDGVNEGTINLIRLALLAKAIYDGYRVFELNDSGVNKDSTKIPMLYLGQNRDGGVEATVRFETDFLGR